MKRLVVLVAVASVFGVGFSDCNPTLGCSNPTVLTGPTDGVAFSGGYRVNQDQWSGQGSQTMYVCSQGDWKAVVTQSGAPETGVKTYPDSERTYTDWQYCSSQPRLDSFTTLSSTFGHVVPDTGAYNAAYDVFLNGGLCGKPTVEVMIWTHWRGLTVPTAQLHPTIAGVAYDLYYSGNYYQFRQHTQTDSGQVNVLAVLRWLDVYGFLAPSDTLQFVQYGFEILTTYGQPTDFWVKNFSIADS